MQVKELSKYLAEGRFYKTVVEDGSDIIFIVDYKANIIYHNPSVRKTIGHKSLSNKNFFDFIHPKQLKKTKAKFKESIKLPYSSNIEVLFLCLNGDYKYLEFNSINLAYKDNISALILDCRDISERKRGQEELLKAQKIKEQFLANISHEIRTPINGIIGMINLLSNKIQWDEQVKYLNAVKHAANNLKVIITDILDYSLIQSDKVSLERIDFDINYQIKSAISSIELIAAEKHIKIDFITEGDSINILVGDPVRLNQILINLINNAIKFTSNEGKVTIILFYTVEEGDKVIANFEVKDTGIGINPIEIKHIFDPFKQADESITRKYGGTGLGLAICKQLVDLQGGKISVKSKVDIGTTFYFSIPYILSSNNKLVHQRLSLKDQFKNLPTSKPKLLLVEDNAINRLYASAMLKKWEFNFDEAVNGKIALEMLQKNHYDLVLMDIHMPVVDGLEATRIIRKEFLPPKRDIPIIAFTANISKEEKKKYYAIGMNDYISKPFIPDDLYNIIIKYYKPNSLKSDSNSKTPLVNLTYLNSISEGNKEFVNEIISAFISKTPILLSDMIEASEKENWKVTGDLAHQLKPNLVMLGISQLDSLVRSIESDGRNSKNTPTIKSRVKLLTHKCELAIQEIKSHRT